MLGGPLSVMKVWLMPANDKSTQDYFGHAIILSDTHVTSMDFIVTYRNGSFPNFDLKKSATKSQAFHRDPSDDHLSGKGGHVSYDVY